MKKTMILFCLLISVTCFSQRPDRSDRPHQREKMERPNFTPEQVAELRVKELTLLLDLTPQQQGLVRELELTAAKEREEKRTSKKPSEELSDDEKFNLRMAMLDKQIARKNSMQNILNDEQFELWKKEGKNRRKQGFQGRHRGKNTGKK